MQESKDKLRCVGWLTTLAGLSDIKFRADQNDPAWVALSCGL